MTRKHSKPVKALLRLYNMKIKALGHGLEPNIAHALVLLFHIVRVVVL